MRYRVTYELNGISGCSSYVEAENAGEAAMLIIDNLKYDDEFHLEGVMEDETDKQ